MLVAIIVTLLLAALFFGAEYYVYRLVFKGVKNLGEEGEIPEALSSNRHRGEMDALMEKMKKIPCTFLHTRSFDGLRLSARYYHTADGAPLDICFHGYRGSAIRDFCGGGQFLMDEGHNLLIVDERAHYKSGGKALTFGIKERRDVKSWCDYAARRFPDVTDITVFGISMGAATVLMASSLDFPPAVRRIIADCPYSSPKDIIMTVMEKMKLPSKFLYPFVRLSGKIYAGFDLEETTAADEVKNAKLPILIIHGEDDGFVPEEMSEKIARANPALVERHTFPNAGHGLSFLEDRERYIAIVRAFLKKTA